MSTSVQGYLEQEIAAGERSAKIGMIGLIVVAIILVCYFQWLRGTITEITEPGNIAALMMSEVKRNIPAAREATKDGLRQGAPQLVSSVVDTVLDKAIPSMRAAVDGLFRDYARELTTLGVESTGKVFEEIVKEHSDELRAKISIEPGMYTTENLVKDLEGLVKREFVTRLNSIPEETAGAKLRASLVALRNINARLRTLAQKSDTRTDELGRKLITTWWSMLQNLEPDKSAAEKMMEGRPMPKTPEAIEELRKGE